ncbi:MAG: ABC transporter substrate-binding protein [Dehalococcoidia bacterium]|nr:ABC transporter substrate-binding protein [Dehalococcoidia bacterium]
MAINARGAATEYWLELALQTGGLSISDIDLQTVPFGDVAAALDNGSIDASMLGEPLTTLGEDQDLVQVLTEDFVDGQQPTAVFWNREWAENNPEVAEGFLDAYLRAVERLENGGWEDPAVLALLEEYTNVPADVIARSSRPFNSVEGELDLEGFRNQETFFREQGLLTYDGELDFETFMRTGE